MIAATKSSLHPMQLHGGATAFMLESAVTQRAVDDEHFGLGMVRLSSKREVLFINHAARQTFGSAMRLGMDIADLPLDEGSRASLGNAMRQRFESEAASSYHLRFKRPDDDTWVRVMISAIPEYNTDGECVSSMGYILDETLDSSVLAIHKVIADANDCHGLLEQVTGQLREIFAFDSLSVTGISEERNHLVQIFEHPPPPCFVSPTKWWPMPGFVKSMIDKGEDGPLNLVEMFATPEFKAFAEIEEDALRFEQRGFRSCVRVAVRRSGKLVAMLALLRKDGPAFTGDDHKRLLQLPLNEAVLAAMNFAQKNELEFGANFVQQIAKVADNTDAVAQMLVNELGRHYLWSHVSLFRLDENENVFRLVCEAEGSVQKLSPDYCQPVSVGFLGEAYHGKKTINVGDVKQERWAGRYHPLLKGTRAEMVLPVPGTDGRWLLNVESNLREAFANAEQESVEVQLQIAGFILERTASLELKTAIFNSVADAVIRTNDLFVIVEANPAAERLLGKDRGSLVGSPLGNLIGFDAEFIEDANRHGYSDSRSKDPAHAALSHVVVCTEPTPVRLKCGNGSLIPVLLSAAPLPVRLGGKVFVASDLREQQRIQRMEVLNNVFLQLTSEIRVPLALSEAFLEEAILNTSGDAQELVDKTIKQIRKADMPLERMVRLAMRGQEVPLPRTNFDLHDAVSRLVTEFPEHEAQDIALHARAGILPVHAPRHELMFCVRSLVAYLMRRKAQVEAVDIRLVTEGPEAVIALALEPRKNSLAPATPMDEAAPDSDFELALTEPVIRNLMDRMGGRYCPDAGARRHFELRIAAE